MENFTLIELYLLKNKLIKENVSFDVINDVLDAIKVIEDRIVEGDIGVFAHPKDISKTPIGPMSQYGDQGDKDNVSIPYNPGGGNKMTQKLPMGKAHGAMTGKKSREKRVDVNALRAALRKRKDFEATPPENRERKVMNFDNFTKDEINTVKK